MDYREAWLKDAREDHGEAAYKKVGWNSRESQEARLEVLQELVWPGDRVLDVGCGTGHFHKMLLDSGMEHEYVGIDLVLDNIVEAQRKFQDGSKFMMKDILQLKDLGKFNVVVASGIFAYATEAPHMYLLEVVERMLHLSEETVAFNCLSALNTFNDGKHVYWEPGDVLRLCSRFHLPMVLRHDYMNHDFTMVLYKEPINTNKE